MSTEKAQIIDHNTEKNSEGGKMGAVKQMMLEAMDKRNSILSRKPPGRGARRCRNCGAIYNIIKGHHQDGFPIVEHHPFEECEQCMTGE